MFDQSEQNLKELAAVLELAKTLASYGQHDRVMSLLSLAEWLYPNDPRVCELRLKTQMKLGQWELALDTVLTSSELSQVNPQILAKIYWNLGQRKMGDRHFLSNRDN